MRQDIYPNPSYPSLFPIFCLPAFLLSFPLPSSLSLLFFWYPCGPNRCAPIFPLALLTFLSTMFFSAFHCVLLHLHLVHVHTSLPGPRLERGTSVPGVYVANECHTLML